MTKPKGLGRGLDALLGSSRGPATSAPPHPDELKDFPSSKASNSGVNAIQEVAIADIEANPNQPRKAFDEAELVELSESIRQHGLIQPITLRKIRASRYQIISGERRFRAAQRAGLSSLPAYIREANDQELLEMALVENIQRKDLNPLEISMSFLHLMEECNATQDMLAQRVGMGRSSVTNYLRMLDLPERVQELMKSGALTFGHGKALAGIKGQDATFLQVAMAEKASSEGISVRELERWAKQGGWKNSVSSSRGFLSALTDDEVQALDSLRLKLNGTEAKLSLKRQPDGGGKLVLTYRNLDQLEAVLEKLGLD